MKYGYRYRPIQMPLIYTYYFILQTRIGRAIKAGDAEELQKCFADGEDPLYKDRVFNVLYFWLTLGIDGQQLRLCLDHAGLLIEHIYNFRPEKVRRSN